MSTRSSNYKMHSPNRSKLISCSELEDLVKNSQNEELHRILQNTKPSNWIFDDGSSLLHLAVVHNNQEMIKHLLDTRNDVNAKNSSGHTPLLIALKSDNYEAVEMLLEADADTSVIDQSTKKIALRRLTEHIIIEGIKDFTPNLEDNLKREKLDAESLVEILTIGKCSFGYVRLLNDHEVSREFLRRNPSTCCASDVLRAEEQQDLETLKSILFYGSSYYTLIFKQRFYYLCREKRNNAELWPGFIQCLIDCDLLCKEIISELHYMFSGANEKYLQILLDLRIDVEVREKFSIDLRAAIFGNRNVNAIEILRNRNFDINVTGLGQYTALHNATHEGLINNMRFLLDSGADINCKSESGMTPLLYCLMSGDERCGRVLLEYGANVQMFSENEKTILEFALGCKKKTFLELIIARLALDHIQGVPIQEVYQKLIDSESDHRTIYDACCQQLEALKTREIVKSVTFYAVLTEKLEILCRFLSNLDTISLLDQYKSQFELHPLFYSMLKHKLVKALNLYRFKCDLANVMTENTGLTVDFDNIAIRNISKHLTQWDIEQFSESCRKSSPTKSNN